MGVSIRAPARGATYPNNDPVIYGVFRSAPPHGGRPARRPRTGNHHRFRSAPPHGGRPPRSVRCVGSAGFDPRPRTGGDRWSNIGFSRTPVFRSAPPHGGRLDGLVHPARARSVSIRAPARGATWREPEWVFCRDVSIRAPARGATAMRRAPSRFRWCFDPRPRTGGDSDAIRSLLTIVQFRSAPPHGGRRASCVHWKRGRLFRSAPPHGGRRADAVSTPYFRMFRSAPPHGGRRGQTDAQMVER